LEALTESRERRGLIWRNFLAEDADTQEITRELIEAFNHKLSQPLTSLRCCLELVTLRPGDRDGLLRQLELATAEADRAIAWMRSFQELLDIVIPSDRHETVDLCELLRECVADLRLVADKRTIGIALSLPERAVVQGTRLREGVWRLLSACIRENQQGGDIAVSVEAGTATTLVVEDSKIDPLSMTQEIFDPFARPGCDSDLSWTIAAVVLRDAKATVEVMPSAAGHRRIVARFPEMPKT
jgi:signal transduction histidine kinase